MARRFWDQVTCTPHCTRMLAHAHTLTHTHTHARFHTSHKHHAHAHALAHALAHAHAHTHAHCRDTRADVTQALQRAFPLATGRKSGRGTDPVGS